MKIKMSILVSILVSDKNFEKCLKVAMVLLMVCLL
jgi:hypothetical protein